MKEVPYRFLMVDGTKVRLQGPGGKDLGYKEMRWALASEGMRLQRCLWHGKQDFPFLLYADGLKKASKQPLRNAVESAFSRIVNRIKRMGKHWSDRGLLEWLVLAMAKVFRPELWDQLWKQYMRINRKISLVRCRAQYVWL